MHESTGYARSRPKVLLSLALLAGLLVACSQELTLQQQIIATLRNMEAHIEQGERREFMAYVATDFRGQGGELNYDQLNALLLYQLRRYQRVHAQLLPVTVREAGLDEAEASFRILLTGGNKGLLPENGQLYEISSLWRYQDGDWLLQSAQWQPVRVVGN
jgi:hypothetical protein